MSSEVFKDENTIKITTIESNSFRRNGDENGVVLFLNLFIRPIATIVIAGPLPTRFVYGSRSASRTGSGVR